MAFIYETQDDAIAALELADVPNGTHVERNHDIDRWGWQDAADKPEEKAELPPREAQPGDIVLQIGGAFLPAHARLEALRLARKLGITITLRDAFEPTRIVETVTKPAGSAGSSGGGLDRDERGLTNKQAIILDLMMRESGATNRQLVAAGATDAKGVNWQYQQNCITRATDGRFAKGRSILVDETGETGKVGEVKAFRMTEVAESDRAQVLYDVECEMVANKQLKKVMATKPVAPVSNDDAGYLLAAD